MNYPSCFFLNPNDVIQKFLDPTAVFHLTIFSQNSDDLLWLAFQLVRVVRHSQNTF